MRLILLSLLAGALSYALTPLAIRIAPYVGAVDVPTDERRMHRHPMPRCGGLALFFAFAMTAAWSGLPLGELRALVAGGVLLVILGILDDVFRLPAMCKLSVQMAAALIAVSGVEHRGAWSWLGMTVWLVALINAHNMIDGLDGLVTGVSAVEAAMLALALGGQGSGAVVATWTVAGLCLGYLPYNRHPARIFLGDTGSQFLGYVLGVLSLSIDRGQAGTLGALVTPLIFALPLADLGFAVVRRTLRGQSPFAADRGHFHHRLYDAGWGQRGSCGWLWLLSLLLGLAGVFVSREEWYGFAVYMIFLTVGGCLLLEWCSEGRNKSEDASSEK